MENNFQKKLEQVRNLKTRMVNTIPGKNNNISEREYIHDVGYFSQLEERVTVSLETSDFKNVNQLLEMILKLDAKY